MDNKKPINPFEATEAHAVLEAARDDKQEFPSFVQELFMGRLNPNLIFPFPEQTAEDKAIGDAFLAELEAFLKEKVDADEIDKTGEIPKEVMDGLAKMGCFAMKVPKEYGGLGFSQVNYNRAMTMIGSYCGSTAVLLSAHQSIGVPQPLKMFGTEEQKKKYLPRFREGDVSAFALTEPDVGSDPAQMSTVAEPTEDGEHYIINGQKLWCTNGPIADVLVVMAKTPDRVIGGKKRTQITAFIVEKDTPGFEVEHRCEFMGLKAIYNGLLRFKDVKVPKENIIWGPGRGLKLALATLNTGRLTLPAACLGSAKKCAQVLREWTVERVQWGESIGKHEAVADRMGWMMSHLLTLDSMVQLTSAWTDRGDADIRIEAAIAKLYGSEVAWKIVDDTMQTRGGRGYETAPSLKGRGEKGHPIERIMRDMRINLIIEGTSDVMHLFLAREALDPHIKLAFDMVLPGTPLKKKVKAFFKAGFFYALWYPMLWLPLPVKMPPGLHPSLRKHWSFIGRKSRALARTLFHNMMRYQSKLEKRQMVLFRIVDVGVDLFGMAAALSYATSKEQEGDTSNAVELADLFCKFARRRVRRTLSHIQHSEDKLNYQVAQNLMDGKYAWLEDGIVQED